MIGQFRKANRMFSSRRIKSNKVFKDGSQLFIKSSILKNFCSEVIRTVIWVPEVLFFFREERAVNTERRKIRTSGHGGLESHFHDL